MSVTNKRRSIAVLVCLMMMVSTGYAQTLGIGSTSGNPGETVTLNVDFTAANGVTGLTAEISYDTTVLTSAVTTNCLSNDPGYLLASCQENEPGVITLVITDFGGLATTAPLGHLSFNINTASTPGMTPLAVSVTDCVVNATPLNCAGADGHITIADGSSSPTMTITATDPTATEENTTTGQFTVTSSAAAPGGGLSIACTWSGTATDGADYHSSAVCPLTIPAGATATAVTVTPIDDTDIESDETVVLSINAGSGYTLGAPSSATVTIADNDTSTPPPVLPTATVTATGRHAAEPSTDGELTIALSEAVASAVTINFNVSGTASPDVDYRSLGSSVAISAGGSSVTVPVSIIDDAMVENSETVVVTLVTGDGYTVSLPNSATVVIADDETVPPPSPVPGLTEWGMYTLLVLLLGTGLVGCWRRIGRS